MYIYIYIFHIYINIYIFRSSNSDFWGLLLGAILGPKVYQNRSQERPRSWSFLLIDLKIVFGNDFVPTWPHLDPPLPKNAASWLQNWFELGCWFASCFRMNWSWQHFVDFLSQHDMAEVTKSKQKQTALTFLDFWLLCCWGDLLIDVCLLFGPFWGRTSTNNQSKSIKGDQN